MSIHPNLRTRLLRLRDVLGHGLVERDVPLRLALLAALAGEHMLLLGPPGTAKSELARRLRGAIRDGQYFERLLTRFSVPEELFGPLSIKGLEQDRYERQTLGFLPTAHVVFLDEVFKSNSAILNSLLTLLNERQFDNGTSRHAAPLVTVIAASNELPDGEELNALYDRFLLRFQVEPVSDAGFASLLAVDDRARAVVDLALAFTPAELEELRRAAETVSLGNDVRQLLADLRRHLAEQAIFVSDRRWRKIVALLRVAAMTDGRSGVSVWDAWLLQHCTWEKPEQRASVADWYAWRVGAAAPADAVRFERVVTEHETLLQRERDRKEQATDAEGRLLYEDPAGPPSIEQEGWRRRVRNGEPLFLAQASSRDRANSGEGYTRTELDRYGRLPDSYFEDPNNWYQERFTRQALLKSATYHAAHIDNRVRTVRDHRGQVAALSCLIDANIATATAQIQTHLWLDPAFAEPAVLNLRAALCQARALDARLERVEAGFAALPRAPEPTLQTGAES